MRNTDTKYFILALKVKELRKKRKISLKSLAEKSGISISYLNEIEKAKKYPRPDKLKLLADTLLVTPKYLNSADAGTMLKPIINLFNINIEEKLPLKEFNISIYDLFEVISTSTEKCSALLIILLQIIDHYDLNLENVSPLALKAYQQIHLNHFAEIEKLSTLQGQYKYESLITKLEQVYDLEVEESSDFFKGELKSLCYVFNKGVSNKLIINAHLTIKDKVFLLAKILYYCCKKQEVPMPPWPNCNDYQVLFGQFKSEYFACALIIPQEQIVNQLKAFFGSVNFKVKAIQDMMESYHCTPQVFFQRLTQVIPHNFGLNNIYYMITNHNLKSDTFTTSNELHLTQTHWPFVVKEGEQECRRKINISLLQKYQQVDDNYLIDAQISTSIESNETYFVLSIALKRDYHLDLNTCITIGILVNSKVKSIISFLNDKRIKYQNVGRTCERCKLLDCKERVSEAKIYLDH